MYCSNCGKEMDNQSNFCSNCGVEKNVKPKKRMSSKAWGILIISIVAVIAGAILLGTMGNKMRVPKKLNEESQATLSSEEQKLLNDFVAQLVKSYNAGNKENNYFERSDEFVKVYDKLRPVALENNYLHTASSEAYFIYFMSRDGEIEVGTPASPKEMKQEIERRVRKVIDTYYN